MGHCGGGEGPNHFGQGGYEPHEQDPARDLVAALENWVEKGRQPQSLIATRYVDDDPQKPVLRTMPLCPFPAMARFNGTGAVTAAANWSCPVGDRRLLEVGYAGTEAGAQVLPGPL
jgi:feruloyl esterase